MYFLGYNPYLFLHFFLLLLCMSSRLKVLRMVREQWQAETRNKAKEKVQDLSWDDCKLDVIEAYCHDAGSCLVVPSLG